MQLSMYGLCLNLIHKSRAGFIWQNAQSPGDRFTSKNSMDKDKCCGCQFNRQSYYSLGRELRQWHDWLTKSWKRLFFCRLKVQSVLVWQRQVKYNLTFLRLDSKIFTMGQHVHVQIVIWMYWMCLSYKTHMLGQSTLETIESWWRSLATQHLLVCVTTLRCTEQR